MEFLDPSERLTIPIINNAIKSSIADENCKKVIRKYFHFSPLLNKAMDLLQDVHTRDLEGKTLFMIAIVAMNARFRWSVDRYCWWNMPLIREVGILQMNRYLIFK